MIHPANLHRPPTSTSVEDRKSDSREDRGTSADGGRVPVAPFGRQVQVVGALGTYQRIASCRRVFGLSVLGGLGCAAGLSAWAATTLVPDEGGLTALSASMMGLVGLAGGAAIPHLGARIHDAIQYRAERTELRQAGRDPTFQLERLEQLALREAPLTMGGLENCVRNIFRLQAEAGASLQAHQVALALARLAGIAMLPAAQGCCGGGPLEQLDLLLGKIRDLHRLQRIDIGQLKEALLTAANALPRYEANLARARAIAERLILSYPMGSGTAQDLRDRADFLTILRDQPFFQPFGPELEAAANRAWGGPLPASIRRLQKSAADACMASKVAVLRRDGMSLIAAFNQSFTRETKGHYAQQCDALLLELARHGAGEVRPNELERLRERLLTRPVDAKSITPGQSRALAVLQCLSGGLPRLSMSAADATEAAQDDAWDDAGCDVLAALSSFALKLPKNASLRTLATRAANIERLISALDRTAPSRLPMEVHHAMRTIFSRRMPLRERVHYYHSVLQHLEKRDGLPAGAFLEGVAAADRIERLLSRIKADVGRTDAERHALSEQIIDMPRMCQLAATPELLDAAYRLLERLWSQAGASGGDLDAQRRIADDYKVQAWKRADLRIIPNRLMRSPFDDQRHLHRPWPLPAQHPAAVRGPRAEAASVDIEVGDFERSYAPTAVSDWTASRADARAPSRAPD
ncbi:hypothetical protein JI739_08535 [Ramlibacter sp. AW1]|uniref:Uncharacterized protein n=1 Tax=Ramlibacter aurantiacus TaxID=2801330 RepID=A0A936ZQ20_9BURK|nr:hypothetical protein [Ramlibacter aurantiacus]MBL0420386.1 hypothetical protein [Ramlibacter aurantiacus]